MTTVTQTTPFAETYVTCSGIVQNGGPETGEISMTVTNGAIEWNLLDDEVVFCNWFVGQGLAPATPTGADDNTVTVYKWECPVGTTYGMDQDYYGAECATEHLNIPIALVDANGEHATTTQANGTQWNNVTIGPVGELQIIEEIPDGFGDPVVFCWSNDGDPVLVPSVNGFVIPQPDLLEERFDYYCNWYNLPGDGSTIVVTKWECPEGTAYDQDPEWYEANCTVLMEDIDFKLTHSEGVEYQTTGAEGMVEWGNVPIGPFSILEHIPPEYEEPVVICGFTAFQNGAILDGFPQRVDTPGGYFEAEFTIPATSYFCNWYNIPGGPGEITVIKYTCPEGYDLNAFRAEPMEDCTELTNGVNFTLIDDDPGTVDLQTMTGDSIDGAVYFGGLEPGPYTIIETVPADTWYVFVLDCYGQRMGELRPYPLEFGDTLDLHLSAGESIVCYWYNVPEWDPEFGRLTVYKLDCSTLTYVSDVDCEVYEGGKDFDLVFWNGSAWEHADTQTTDGFGKIMWFNLTPGEYWVDELGDDWCFMKSEQLSDDGNWLNVYDNQETVVVVYNCGGKDPGTPGKTPTKYPDTGVGPDQSGPLQELPAFAPLTGLLALLASRRNTRRPNFVGEVLRVLPPTRPFAASPRTGTQAGPCESRDSYGRTRVSSPTTRETPMTDTHSRRRFAAAALALPLGGTALIRSGIFAQGDQVVEPIDGTPTEGTPASLCLTATPDAATPVDGSDCFRGAVPAGLTIASIGVEAPVEILETVGGVMQQPSDENHVAWYKETARLGELGNILIAGHLNWWGVPEAVFFALGTLEEGAEVVLVDEDGDAYTYAVEWVRQESNLEPPSEEVLGMTDYEAVTLITCGGEWDNSISEYDERTVARARRVAASGTPEAA
ncbi:MAG: class F sortase [Chloroflexia bacterium]|nr:class F sortase [Chloroflexia bacterium]